jgi:hypothetical protein
MPQAPEDRLLADGDTRKYSAYLPVLIQTGTIALNRYPVFAALEGNVPVMIYQQSGEQ